MSEVPQSLPQQPEAPRPEIVLDLMQAFRRSKVLFASLALGVYDALGDGAASAAELAGRLEANADALERLLDACVSLGLLRTTASGYANTPTSRAYLCRDSERRITGYLNYSNAYLWKMWGHLEDAVREGTHRWPQAFGWDGPLFSNFFHSEDAKREFLLGMHGMGLMSSPHVVAAFDLSPYRRLVDLGGATGHLAVAACERFPHLEAVVFDLPATLPLARELLSHSRVGSRVQLASGNFFRDPLPAGDLFALGRIVHDWTEDKIDALLARVYAQLPPGGAILIAEKLLDDDKSGPPWAVAQSLNMLVCTEGKERTLSEYRCLLERAGFGDVQACRTASPLDAVMARKSGETSAQ